MRLIDADALKEKLIEIFESDPYPENEYMDGWTFAEFSRDELKPIIDEAPTIEAEPNRCEYWDSESLFCALRRPQAEQTTHEEFEWCHDCKEYDQEQHCCHRWTKVIWNTVEELRTDYAPIKHGRWEKVDDNPYEYVAVCSICHNEVKQPTCMLKPIYSYCPICGAKMDEVEE